MRAGPIEDHKCTGYRQTKVLRCCPPPQRFIQKDQVCFHLDGESDGFLLARQYPVIVG